MIDLLPNSETFFKPKFGVQKPTLTDGVVSLLTNWPYSTDHTLVSLQKATEFQSDSTFVRTSQCGKPNFVGHFRWHFKATDFAGDFGLCPKLKLWSIFGVWELRLANLVGAYQFHASLFAAQTGTCPSIRKESLHLITLFGSWTIPFAEIGNLNDDLARNHFSSCHPPKSNLSDRHLL